MFFKCPYHKTMGHADARDNAARARPTVLTARPCVLRLAITIPNFKL